MKLLFGYIQLLMWWGQWVAKLCVVSWAFSSTRSVQFLQFCKLCSVVELAIVLSVRYKAGFRLELLV